MLNVDQISFSYGSRKIIDNVTFDIVPGEIVALVGINGAGKTTLLKILATLLIQDSGRVHLHGLNPLERPIRYRRSIGYLAESCPLYNEMRVEEYLRYRTLLKGERTLRRRRRINDALEACNLQDVRKSLIKQLSHGYRKRVSVAEALLTNPKLLLLDDLLAGLDPSQRKRCVVALTTASSRSAIIVTGHEIGEMCDWCTRFIVLRNGGIHANLRIGMYERAQLIEMVEAAINGTPYEGVPHNEAGGATP